MGSGIEFFARVENRPGLAVILDALKWDQDGLVAVVAQDAANKEVLGVAFADRVALQKTFETGLMHYYSRSRKKLWLKGEESGHVQKLVEMRVDCDGDAVLAQVNQVQGNCHSASAPASATSWCGRGMANGPSRKRAARSSIRSRSTSGSRHGDAETRRTCSRQVSGGSPA